MKSGTNALSLTTKTDYYPFGMPMPNRYTTDNNYRYAFQGQEKDLETGMEAFELRLWDGRIGRWLTIDPYHEFFSPYLGMGNNPNITIDIDGGRIFVTSINNINYEYKNGDLYDSKGNLYTGNDEFLITNRNALRKLDYATSYYTMNEGKLIKKGKLHDMVTSTDVYRIGYRRKTAGSRGNAVFMDHKSRETTPLLLTTGGLERAPYEVTLAHELGHAFSFNNKIKNTRTWFTLQTSNGPEDVSYDENFAMHFENDFRRALGLKERTHYSYEDSTFKPIEVSKLFFPHMFPLMPVMVSGLKPAELVSVNPRYF